MSNFDHCPTPDNDDEEEGQEEIAAVEDPFLSLTGTNEQYVPRTNINVFP